MAVLRTRPDLTLYVNISEFWFVMCSFESQSLINKMCSYSYMKQSTPGSPSISNYCKIICSHPPSASASCGISLIEKWALLGITYFGSSVAIRCSNPTFSLNWKMSLMSFALNPAMYLVMLCVLWELKESEPLGFQLVVLNLIKILLSQPLTYSRIWQHCIQYSYS